MSQRNRQAEQNKFCIPVGAGCVLRTSAGRISVGIEVRITCRFSAIFASKVKMDEEEAKLVRVDSQMDPTLEGNKGTMETLDGAEGEACVDESDGFFKGFGRWRIK